MPDVRGVEGSSECFLFGAFDGGATPRASRACHFVPCPSRPGLTRGINGLWTVTRTSGAKVLGKISALAPGPDRVGGGNGPKAKELEKPRARRATSRGGSPGRGCGRRATSCREGPTGTPRGCCPSPRRGSHGPTRTVGSRPFHPLGLPRSSRDTSLGTTPTRCQSCHTIQKRSVRRSSPVRLRHIRRLCP